MKKQLFKNNKGVAVITVMITIMFLAVIATATLYISTTNYAMKVANVYGKDNFYETDGYLVKTTTSLRTKVMNSPSNLGGDIVTSLPTDAASGSFDVLKIAQLVDSSASGGASSATFEVDNTYYPGKKDTIEIKSPAHEISKEALAGNPGVTRYTFKDIEIIQTSTNGFQNSVKTDLVFDIRENINPSNSSGGVGNMSMLLDSPISSTAANFKNLTMTGNAFMASYADTKTTWTDGDGAEYFAPGKKDGTPGPGLLMTNESRLNLYGDNSVIYGDLVMSGNSSLAVYGNLTVYGDIYVSGNATLILADGANLYQLTSVALPGRSGVSTISAGTKNIFPSTITVKDVTKDKFIKFADTVGIRNTDIKDRGLINKIFAKDFSSDFSGKRFIDLNPPESPDNQTIKVVSATGLDITNDSLNRNYMLKDDKLGIGKFGVGFIPYGTNTSSLNNNDANDVKGGNYSHKLIICFNNSPVILQQSTPYSTWICKSPVSATQAHCVVLSKVGTTEFNYMTAGKGDTDSKIFDTSDNPFNNVEIKVCGKTYSGKFGELFDPNCNVYVDQMFGYSLGDDGGSGSKTYDSTISFSGYERDFE